MAHDPGSAHHANDKFTQALTSDGASRHDGDANADNSVAGSSSRAPPIQEYSVERVEKVYRFVFLILKIHLWV